MFILSSPLNSFYTYFDNLSNTYHSNKPLHMKRYETSLLNAITVKQTVKALQAQLTQGRMQI